MAGFGLFLLTIFGLTLMLCPCQGQITSPGESFTFLTGATAKLTWSFKNDPTTASFRAWYFTSTDGVFDHDALGRIVDDDPPSKITSLLDVAIEKPGTLLLKNVNHTYDGKYRFSVTAPSGGSGTSTVVVFIAKKPKVTFSCRRCPVALNEGENFTCLCKGEGGNPPANVTWFKDGVKFTDVGTQNQTLNLLNVRSSDNGTYTCVARSYAHENYTDEQSCQVIVNFQPANTRINFSQNPAVINRLVVITCRFDGQPKPSYTIYHNGTFHVSTNKPYERIVTWKDAGTYECIAINKLGNDSDSKFLHVTDKPRPTLLSMTGSTSLSSASTGVSNPCDGLASTDGETKWYIVVVSLLSGIIVGILFSYIFLCSRRKFRSRESQQSNPEPSTSQVNSTYQELDLKKMDKEDNYQSLGGCAAKKDNVDNDESTYTDLVKTRDVENNYQSLS